MKSLNEILTNLLRENECEKVPTGFSELDTILGGGLNKEKVTLVAGRPYMGKTSFLLDISMHYARSTGKKVAFFTSEDGEEFVALRILSKASKNAEDYITVYSSYELNQKMKKDVSELLSAYNKVKDLPMLIYWNPAISPFEIKRVCEGIDQLGMIIIDFSKRLDMGGVAGNFLADLSQVAMSLHVPVICSCKVSRSVEFYEDHRPDRKSILDFEVAGMPEPTIIALYRQGSYYGQWQDVSKQPAEAIVIPYRKTGNGGGTANLIWNKTRKRFENIEY